MTADELTLDRDDVLTLSVALSGSLRRLDLILASALPADERARWQDERDRTAALLDAVRIARTITIEMRPRHDA